MRWLCVLLMIGCDGSKEPANPPDTDVPDTDVPDTDVPDTDVADTDLPDTDVPDTDPPDTDLPGDTDPPVDTDTGNPPIAPCRLTPATATPVAIRDVAPNLSGYIDSFALYQGTTSARVIQDQAGYDQLAAMLGVALDPVDFTAETVIFGWRGVTSTCGLTVEHFDVLQIPGTSDVVYQLAIRDSSGNCPIACDMIQVMGRVVAFPKSNNPEVCTMDLNQCP